jgi:hypothetical protein
VPTVNFDFLDRRSAERFAELLEESADSRRHHTAHGAISPSPVDDQLAELVSVGRSLSAARPGARVDPEFRVGLRAMLVATADRDGIGRTAADGTALEAAPDRSAVPARSGSRFAVFGLGGRRIRARGAIVLGVAAGAMAVSGISAASENASPGDALYGVKRSTERAQLAMAGSDVTRGQLSLDFARTRLTEAAAMAGDSNEFGRVLDDMDNDTRKGVALLTTSAVARHDTKPLTTVSIFTTGQERTLNPVLSKLSDTNRTRALGSISLLNAVQQRVGDLRGGLSCTSATSIGSDSLGPKLKGCSAQPNGQSSDGRSTTGRSGKLSGRSPLEVTPVHPRRTSAPAKPKVTGGTRAPAHPKAATTTATSDRFEPGEIAPDGLTPDGVLPSDTVPLPTDPVQGGRNAFSGLLSGLIGND